MGYGDGIERPITDKEGHTPGCRVWGGYYWYDACDCGAVSVPATRTLPGYSAYEILEGGEVRNVHTGRLLKHDNARNTATLIDDDGGKHIWNVWDLTRKAFSELL